MGKYESLNFFDPVLGLGRKIWRRKPEEKTEKKPEEYGHDSHGISKLPPPPVKPGSQTEARRKRDEEFDQFIRKILAVKKTAQQTAEEQQLLQLSARIFGDLIAAGQEPNTYLADKSVELARELISKAKGGPA